MLEQEKNWTPLLSKKARKRFRGPRNRWWDSWKLQRNRSAKHQKEQRQAQHNSTRGPGGKNPEEQNLASPSTGQAHSLMCIRTGCSIQQSISSRELYPQPRGHLLGTISRESLLFHTELPQGPENQKHCNERTWIQPATAPQWETALGNKKGQILTNQSTGSRRCGPGNVV